MRTYLALLAAAGLILAVSGTAKATVTIDLVRVGNPGNAADTTVFGDYGAVGYTYDIGKYEVTAGQYTEFLNAVADTDTYGLYNTSMWSDTTYGCNIQQTGAPGTWSYSVASAYADRPVNYVSWYDAVRFANWLHNAQPTGAQGPATTEDGSYYLNGAMTAAELLGITRKPGATWVIPSEDEWFKAAYHMNDGVTGNYFDYPTGSNTVPTAEGPPGGANSANYLNAVGNPIDVGSYPNSASPYGTFDQGGNVWEWNDSLFVVDGKVDTNMRGSAYYASGAELGTDTKFWIWPATYEKKWTGFRVALVPEPVTMLGVFLGVAGLGGYVRKRKRA